MHIVNIVLGCTVEVALFVSLDDLEEEIIHIFIEVRILIIYFEKKPNQSGSRY